MGKIFKKTLIAVGGPKGTGKTSLIKKVIKEVPSFKVISSGKLLQALSLAMYENDFVNLSSPEKDIIRKKYAQEVLKDNNLILDIHFGEFEDGGYPCVIPKKIRDKITHFVLVTNDTETVQQRRLSDRKHRRIDVVSTRLNIIGEEMLFDELVKDKQSASLRIVNTDIEQSLRELAKFIKNSTNI